MAELRKPLTRGRERLGSKTIPEALLRLCQKDDRAALPDTRALSDRRQDSIRDTEGLAEKGLTDDRLLADKQTQEESHPWILNLQNGSMRSV